MRSDDFKECDNCDFTSSTEAEEGALEAKRRRKNKTFEDCVTDDSGHSEVEFDEEDIQGNCRHLNSDVRARTSCCSEEAGTCSRARVSSKVRICKLAIIIYVIQAIKLWLYSHSAHSGKADLKSKKGFFSKFRSPHQKRRPDHHLIEACRTKKNNVEDQYPLLGNLLKGPAPDNRLHQHRENAAHTQCQKKVSIYYIKKYIV
ncbi:uncharacterized protein LOC119914851 isoform X1 [Micropterus salmoides]|uniref:uncharacterized protein LOC119914851 isoform X1 n=1 Tax=Micropterus salmoides TaxID=27706 RepID=UPI0018ED077C|nr:uncharacterized protein LOC119914851 isoform X1 [Micropterus salmoides]